MNDINMNNDRVDAYSVSQFIATFCAKHNLTKSQVLPCAGAQTRPKLLFARHRPVKKVIPPHIVVQDGTAIGRRSDGGVVALTLDDIDTCKLAHVPFVLPENLYGNTEVYTEEIKNYISTKDLSDSEYESD